MKWFRLAMLDGEVLRVASDTGDVVEVRGHLDVDASDPLQVLIDRLPGGLVGGELMAGNVAHVDGRSYAAALDVLERLFAE